MVAQETDCAGKGKGEDYGTSAAGGVGVGVGASKEGGRTDRVKRVSMGWGNIWQLKWMGDSVEKRETKRRSMSKSSCRRFSPPVPRRIARLSKIGKQGEMVRFLCTLDMTVSGLIMPTSQSASCMGTTMRPIQPSKKKRAWLSIRPSVLPSLPP